MEQLEAAFYLSCVGVNNLKFFDLSLTLGRPPLHIVSFYSVYNTDGRKLLAITRNPHKGDKERSSSKAGTCSIF
jgi:hypothetical protein